MIKNFIDTIMTMLLVLFIMIIATALFEQCTKKAIELDIGDDYIAERIEKGIECIPFLIWLNS